MNSRVSILKNSERLAVDPGKIRWLKRLINRGEGQHLEFKTKTNSPDKIVHEFIAFANSEGGMLLVGVSDEGRISGLRYPEEDQMLIMNALKKYCWPHIKIKSSIVKVNEKKWVIIFDVFESHKKPIRFKISKTKRVAFIRYRDKTLQASREAEGILRLKFGNQASTFQYGETENRILKTLDLKRQASFQELKLLTGIDESILSSRLIVLAASNVIDWKPLDRSDLFTARG